MKKYNVNLDFIIDYTKGKITLFLKDENDVIIKQEDFSLEKYGYHFFLQKEMIKDFSFDNVNWSENIKKISKVIEENQICTQIVSNNRNLICGETDEDIYFSIICRFIVEINTVEKVSIKKLEQIANEEDIYIRYLGIYHNEFVPEFKEKYWTEGATYKIKDFLNSINIIDNLVVKCQNFSRDYDKFKIIYEQFMKKVKINYKDTQDNFLDVFSTMKCSVLGFQYALATILERADIDCCFIVNDYIQDFVYKGILNIRIYDNATNQMKKDEKESLRRINTEFTKVYELINCYNL